MTEAEQIAANLTKAMRRLLLRAPFKAGEDIRTLSALRRRGLVEQHGHLPNPYMPSYPIPAYRATKLGIEVRAILERQP